MTTEAVQGYVGISQMEPVTMLKCVGKVVEVRTVLGQVVKGTVVTVDPVTESYVIAGLQDDILYLKLILGHSVRSVSYFNEESIPFNFKFSSKDQSPTIDNLGVLQKSLNKLKDWLQKNMIPVEEADGVLKIGDAVTIQPPYKAGNVLSCNEIVLHKILSIIEKMPAD